jgi:biopolymer transport protein TolR
METERRSSGVAAMAEINITPLVDVLLVLLIIFMVVTPLAQRAFDTALPRPASTPTPSGVPPSLVLELEESGLALNRTPVASLDDLETRLRAFFETHADKTLFVRASGTLQYGRVVEALDVARGAGAGRIGMLRAEADQPATARPPQ